MGWLSALASLIDWHSLRVFVLTTTYTVAEEGITVPYLAKRDAIRNNGGFVDTRGRPDIAERIPELTHSSALKAFVVALSMQGSRYISLGCDLGSHEDSEPLHCVAGGYVQIAAADFHAIGADAYYQLARSIGTFLEARSLDATWELNLEYVAVRYQLSGYDEIFPSIQIWFFARARTLQQARESREALIAALHDAVSAAPALASQP